MKRLLLLTALALCACAPGTSNPSTDPTLATLALKRAPQSVQFKAGTVDAQAVRLTLTGFNLRVNDSNCTAKPAENQIVCELGTVPAGRTYGLPSQGVVIVEARYTDPTGKAVELIAD